MARLPPALRSGDRVGVAALSGHAEPEAIELGLAELRRIGFEPVAASNLQRRDGVFAGSDRQRLDGFHELVGDPEIKAIFFLRGGHGLLRLLDDLDWDLLARNPRAYVGYSDVTPLLLQIVRRLDLVTIHGPMVAVEMARGLEPIESRSLESLLRGAESLSYPLAGPTSGTVTSGPLVGGCLSLLTSMIGTQYDWDANGAVLFWEDVDEPFYRVDRMLTQLRLSGSVSALSGMVTGRVGLERPEIERLQADFECTFAAGLSSGHCRPNLPLPLGALATIDTESNSIRFDLA